MNKLKLSLDQNSKANGNVEPLQIGFHWATAYVNKNDFQYLVFPNPLTNNSYNFDTEKFPKCCTQR